jgi:pSer/pThr/pTyr-binding forkhead associated (FHA) protein
VNRFSDESIEGTPIVDVRLVMFKANGERKDFPLGEGITVIGRQEDCDLRIPLGEISRKHSEVIVHEGTVTVRDTGSANGTFVNNKRVTEQELSPGDHIVMGPVVFTVQIDGEPAEIRQARTRIESRAAAQSGGAGTPVVPSIADDDDSSATEITDLDEDDLLAEASGEMDPISALEQLAASGEQNVVDEVLEEDEEEKEEGEGSKG